MPCTPASATPSAWGTSAWTSSARRRPPRDSSWRPDQKAVRHPEVEGLSRSPTKTSTSSSLASLAWTVSSGWCSSVTRMPPQPSRRRRAPVTLPRPPLSPTADVAAPQGGRGVAQRGPGPHGGDELGLVVAALQAQELLQGGPADDPVDGQAGVALELGQRPHGGVAEDAVDPARVEAERAQALLQLGHVVTAQHRGPAVQEAVTHAKTGLDQGVPGLGAADAVDAEAAEALEGLERRPGWPGRRRRRRRPAHRAGWRVRRCCTSETASPRSPMASGRPTGRPRSPRAAGPWAWPRSGVPGAPRP